jgi:hypothetical protein
MSSPDEPKRPAKKSTPKKGTTSTVGIDIIVHRQLAAESKKLDMTKGEYASAAIAYFTENGLDPTQDHTSLAELSKQMKEGFAKLGVGVTDGVANVRAHNADIGNRLFALTRNFEKTLYAFHQQQQLTTYSYLELIESNLLRHLVQIDSNVFQPIMEHLLRTEQEAYITRGLATRIILHLKNESQVWSAQNAKFTEEREEVLVDELRKYLKSHKLQIPQPNHRPGATAVPTKPATPAPTQAPVTAPATPPVAPKS